MKMNRVKTDRSDAKMICSYASEQTLGLWSPEPDYINECKVLQTVVQLYFRQSTALKNTLHSLDSRGEKSIKLIRSLRRQLKSVQKEIK